MVNNDPIHFSAAAEVETPNWRTTWGHRHAISSRVREAVRVAVKDIPAPKWKNYSVNINRVGAGILDDDNLVSACKPARDEIAAWLGLDDGDENIRWTYSQRQEREHDRARARNAFRRWLEVTVAPVRAQPKALRAPKRLERVKVQAPRRDGGDKLPPIEEIRVGEQLGVALLEWQGVRDVRICKHFIQQGHQWRTQGVRIAEVDIDDTINALMVMRERLRERRALEGVGVIFSGAREGAGSDTPSDNVNLHDVGKSATYMPENPNIPPVNNSPENPQNPPNIPTPPGHYWDGNRWAVAPELGGTIPMGWPAEDVEDEDS